MKTDSALMVGGSLQGLLLPTQASATPIENGLSVAGHGQLMGYTKNAQGVLGWNLLVDFTPALYDFTTFLFGAGGVTGAAGPTLAQVALSYGSAPFIGNDQLFSVQNGLQLWTVPAPGRYTITAKGAANTATTTPNAMQTSVTVDLLQGDVITMAVGQIGTGLHAGCGASYVSSRDRGLLLVASGASGSHAGAGGSLTNTICYKESDNASSAGGEAYAISADVYVAYGCGGAGYTGDGFIGLPQGTTRVNAQSFTHGAEGGINTAGESGGFGGGGAGQIVVLPKSQLVANGGGGAYQGGPMGNNVSSGATGGVSNGPMGPSFASGNNVVSRSTTASVGTRGAGSIRITKIS